ncbi:MAG: hypothetical protein K2G70_07020 [Turicibacter sp.]|nr:hypothetical protein [Turicibacter sp.]
MEERKEQAAVLVEAIHKLCTELGFVLEPYTLDTGLVVMSVYDIQNNNRYFIANKEEE